MQSTTYGFVGVGRMGALMSARLLEAGHKVCVFDVSREAVEVLSVAAPETLDLADGSLLRADLMLRSGRFENALTLYEGVKERFEPVKKPGVGRVMGLVEASSQASGTTWRSPHFPRRSTR